MTSPAKLHPTMEMDIGPIPQTETPEKDEKGPPGAAPVPGVGDTPSPLPLEPGETKDGPPMHYRHRDRKRPQCGADHLDTTPYAKKWDDVTCGDCIANKPERGRKKKVVGPPSEKKAPPKQEQEAPSQAGAILPELIARAFNLAMYANKRPPAPPEPLAMFSVNVVGAMEYYNLLTYAEHPLAGLALSGVILLIAVKDLPEIHNEAELNKAHGMPVDV